MRPIVPDEEYNAAHVIADGVNALRRAINEGFEPWGSYIGGPDTEQKYEDAMARAHADAIATLER